MVASAVAPAGGETVAAVEETDVATAVAAAVKAWWSVAVAAAGVVALTWVDTDCPADSAGEGYAHHHAGHNGCCDRRTAGHRCHSGLVHHRMASAAAGKMMSHVFQTSNFAIGTRNLEKDLFLHTRQGWCTVAQIPNATLQAKRSLRATDSKRMQSSSWLGSADA